MNFDKAIWLLQINTFFEKIGSKKDDIGTSPGGSPLERVKGGPTLFRSHFSPCMMCVQYRGGCSVPWGVIMSTMGDILSTVGVFSTVWGYHDKCGGIS